MRRQYAKPVAGRLSSDIPEPEHAKAVIVADVDRLQWRIRTGTASDARLSLDRSGAVLTANVLVNRRLIRAPQLRWSRRGAGLLLQVRCAVARRGR